MTRPAIELEVGPPVRGMNTYDDPKDLRSGEVVQLTNARPGNPPEVRKGCAAILFAYGSSWKFIPPGVAFYAEEAGKHFIIVWVQIAATGFKLLSIPEDTDGTDVGELFATALTDPHFTALALHGWVYTFIRTTYAASGIRVVEEDGFTLRFGYFDSSPVHNGNVVSVGDASGVFSIGKFYCYAFTAVRRNDDAAFEAGGPAPGIILPPGITATFKPAETIAFMPGIVEGVETYGNRETVEIVDDTINTLYVNWLALDVWGATALSLRGRGATHFRVYRSLGQDTEDESLGATKYFLVDIPLSVLVKTVPYTDIDTASDEVTLTAHGWVDGQELYYSGDAAGLTTGTKYYAIRVDADSFKLAGTYAEALAGTPVIDITSQGTGNHTFVPSFKDELADDVLALTEGVYLTADLYTTPPRADYVEWVKDRLWIQSGGFVYYSEAPGGDGGVPLEYAMLQPEKYATWFKPLEYFFDVDSGSGWGARGLARLGNDIFIFKETSIFAVFGSDPTSGTYPQEISPTIGCAFPHTLTKCETKSRYGNVILFLSNEGPMLIEEGGRIRPFIEFKVKQLWPTKDRELYDDLVNEWDWIKNHCTAKFWRNEWWVMYQNKAGVSRIFSFYFNPEGVIESNAPGGPYEVKLA